MPVPITSTRVYTAVKAQEINDGAKGPSNAVDLEESPTEFNPPVNESVNPDDLATPLAQEKKKPGRKPGSTKK
jgi:hypothetical protein